MASTTQRGKPHAALRYLLWIDGVGGFLVCLGPRFTLGHAAARPTPDIPLLADVSRLHAALQRDAEGYALEAYRPVLVNGQMMERATLRTGDRITLGTSCQLLFHQTMPVSASARLDVASGHRLAYPSSSILLMADTLIISGSLRSHVTAPDLTRPIIIVRDKNLLSLRYEGKMEIDGRVHTGKAPLEPGRTVTTEEVSITLESLGGTAT